jgi:heme/copper-type cytochrome/quinol oxidase subunit 3
MQAYEDGQIGGFLEEGQTAVDEHRKLRMGMLFYVCNDVILAIFFIGSYIFLRGYNTNLRWFPPGTPQASYVVNFWIMIIAVVGGVLYFLGDRALRMNAQPVFRLLMLLALVAYLVDLAGQVWYMGRLPFTVQDGSFATSYIVLSGYHVYHMALGVFLGIGIVNRARLGKYSRDNMTGITSIGYYWYWAAIYAIAFWLLVIIQPPVIAR